MKIPSLRSLILPLVALTGCGGAADGVLPARAGAPPAPEVTLVWVGFGEAERLEGERWVRVPAFDYELTVEQRRYADRWESVKQLRRRHPDYDGSAGPREQTMFFRLDLGAVAADEEVPVRITSTLGPGEGRADREFRTASLVFHPDVSAFAPFDTYRIEQTYAYEHGRLEEMVHLDDGERPWVRNRERATLFVARGLPAPPTRR